MRDGWVFAALRILSAADAEHRGQNADTLFTLLHLAAQLVPRIYAGYAGGVGHLPCNFEDVPEAVAVKPAHRGEIRGEGVGVPGLQLFDQEFHVGLNGFLGGLGLGAGENGLDVVGVGVHGVSLLLAFAVLCRGIVKPMPNATWRMRG